MRIVTLTTDFGTQDGYVGAMKGVVLSRAPAARIVDIAHDVRSFDIAAGAYCLRQAAPMFPTDAIHVGVVDPGVGTSRRGIVVDDAAGVFVGPDNGLFSWVAPAPRAAYAIENPDYMRASVSSTFHGRDLFAACAGTLAAGAPIEGVGARVPVSSLISLDTPADETTDETRARIIYVDRFGNLITDAAGASIPADAAIAIARAGERGARWIERVSRTFGDVAVGELVAYIGSADTLEIAIREGDAARELGLKAGDTVAIASPS